MLEGLKRELKAIGTHVSFSFVASGENTGFAS